MLKYLFHNIFDFFQRNIVKIIIVLAIILAGCVTALITTADKGEQIAASSGVQQLAEKGVLYIGVRDDAPGISQVSQSGEYEGIAIDFAKKLTAALLQDSANAEFVRLSSRNSFGMLESGQIDVIIALITPTPDREKRYAFSKPYYQENLRLAVTSNSLIFYSDISGKKVGVISNALTKEAFNENIKDTEITVEFKEYASYEDLFSALASGKIDYICAEDHVIKKYLREGQTMLDDVVGKLDYCVCVMPENKIITEMADLLIDNQD